VAAATWRRMAVWLTWHGADRQWWRAAAISFGQRRVSTAAPLAALTHGHRTWPGGVANAHATDKAAPLGQSTHGVWQVSR
jgi:hypothetical protein